MLPVIQIYNEMYSVGVLIVKKKEEKEQEEKKRNKKRERCLLRTAMEKDLGKIQWSWQVSIR